MTFEKRIIGDCTLYRGDSLELLKAGTFGKIGAIVSDPPYGIGFQHGGSGIGGNVKTVQTTCNTELIHGDDVPFDPSPWIEAAPLSDSRVSNIASILLWGADHYMQRLPEGGTMLAWDKHI